MTDPDGKLPAVFIDAHHHFIDTTSEIYADFLRSVASDLIYTAEQYQEDVVADLRAAGIEVALSPISKFELAGLADLATSLCDALPRSPCARGKI